MESEIAQNQVTVFRDLLNKTMTLWHADAEKECNSQELSFFPSMTGQYPKLEYRKKYDLECCQQ